MFSKIFSYFFGTPDPCLTLDDAYKVLNESTRTTSKEEKQDEEIEDSKFSSFHKIGTVTSVSENHYVIDGIYEFFSENLNASKDTHVSYIAFINDGKVNVTNVEVIKDDWHCSESGVKRIWCCRSIACKVVQRQTREVIVEPGEMKIDLNTVSSDFVPVQGDWLEIDVKCEIDEEVTDLCGKILEINKIRPLRSKKIQGTVKYWNANDQTGQIDQNVYFNRESYSTGYIPSVGDKVITEAIESEQGSCVWRALKIIPELKVKDTENSVLPLNGIDFQSDIENVYITNNISLKFNSINEIQEFVVEIKNNRNTNIILNKAEFITGNSQCKLNEPTVLEGKVLLPSSTLKVRCKSRCTNFGTSKELLLLTIDNVKVGRWILINLEAQDSSTFTKGRYMNNVSNLHARQARNNKSQNGCVIKGQRPNLPPRFIAKRIPEYRVPQKLSDIVVNCSDIDSLIFDITNIKPCLKHLNFNVYEDYFHTLLHLEEIACEIAMRNYDQDMACFIPNGDFLMLEIDNLSEKRPLMMGDKIIAKDPYNERSMEFEGYIHKVGSKHVHIKFGQMFHDTYKGEDYSIYAVSSRTTFKRRHHAVGLAVRNLGREFLFPSKVDEKKPQLNFIYDKYDDSLEMVDKKIKDRSKPSEFNLNDKPNRNKEILCKLKTYLNTSKSDDDLSPLTSPDKKDNNLTKLLLPIEIEKTATVFSKNGSLNQNLPSLETTHPNKVLKLEWFNKSLNFYQKEAVRNILLGRGRPLPYFIFGPPGTGKTVTLVETILQLIHLMPDSRILVGTPSNSAADVLAIRLIDSGVLKPGDLVRFVAYKCVVDNSIPTKLIPYCATGDPTKEGSHERTFRVTETGLTLGLSSSVIGRHKITVGTCSNLGLLFNMGFPKGHFTHVVIDEAAQLIEPDAMIPLVNLDISCGQAIFAGDPMQLGPVIHSKVAAENGLTESYLDRMLNRFPYIRDVEGFSDTGGLDPRLVTKLIYNYRSLPEILNLSSQLFYNSELRPTISENDSEEACMLRKLKEILPERGNDEPPAMVFHGVNGQNYQTSDSPSWFNPQEASQVFFYVNELLRLGIEAKDIGIISPYIKQIKQIRELFAEAEFEIPKLGTVEEFQGQEFNIVLLSVVRSSENLIDSDVSRSIGFISSPRRLNVALTRAQTLLIIIGNPMILSKDPHWRSVLNYCVKNNAYCGCWLD